MKNIFENAYFGKPYRTRGGKKAFYHGSEQHKSGDGKVWIYHYLMAEPETINVLGADVIINHYDAYINDNGIGRLANLKYCKDSGVNAGYDITSEWDDANPRNEENSNENMIEIEGIAQEHGIKDLDRVSPAYQLGFVRGVKWAKDKLTAKVYHALEKVLAKDMLDEIVKVMNEEWEDDE